MKYQLKSTFRLCGWQGAECGLLDKDTGLVNFITPQKFRHLLFCNGELNVEGLISTADLETYRSEGLIEPVTKGTLPREDSHYIRYDNRFMEYAHWSITGACNFKCRHCYLDSPSNRHSNLSITDMKKIVRQLTECGIFRVKITGGEPLLCKDFWELIDELQNHHIVVDEVYTNGWLVSEEVLLKFASKNMFPTINMSFDGVGWHDWMRRVLGAETKVIQAFRLCRKFGFSTGAEMCVHKGNVDTIRETVNFLASLNVGKIKIGSLFDTDLWKSNCENNYLSNEEFYDACLKYIPQYFEDGCPMRISLSNIFKYNPETKSTWGLPDPSFDGIENPYLCTSARTTIYISPDGTILPCMAATALSEELQAKFPNALSTDLKHILQSSAITCFADMQTSHLCANNSECKQCSHINRCKGGCRIEAMKIGNEWGKDTQACYVYRNAIPTKVKQAIETARKEMMS